MKRKVYLILTVSILLLNSLCSCQTVDRNAKDKLKYFPSSIYNTKIKSVSGDSLLLQTIAADTWKFFENSTYLNTGLVVDKIFVDKQNAAHYTSITNIGLYLVGVSAAYQLNLITKEEAISKIKTTLNTLQKLERYNGFFYNWYEVDVLQQDGDYISTVDSGWLYSSLFIISKIFPNEFGLVCNNLMKEADFGWLYDKKEESFYLGYNVKTKEFSPYHYKLLCSEARMAFYYAAIQKQIDPMLWFKLSRTLDKKFEQEQSPLGNINSIDTISYFNGYYLYDSLKIVPSWGGSAFEFLMTDIFVDESVLTKSMGINNKNVIEAQQDFALNKLNYDVWGMSPCATPDGGYSEFGVSKIGTMVNGYKAGVVTPHASILGINYSTSSVVENIKKLINNYDVYGEYGFYDCIDMKTKEVGKTYLALDQAMIFLSIANYLTDNYIPKIFEQNEEFKKMMELLKKEEFYN